MRIYRLHTSQYSYDEYDAFVVAAGSPGEAREVAQEHAGSGQFGQPKVFTSASATSCSGIGRYDGPRKTAHVILASFNAG